MPKIFLTVLICSLAIITVANHAYKFITPRAEVIKFDTPSPRHARVIWTEQPDKHAIISWTTMIPTTQNTIYYDTLSREADTTRYNFKTESDLDGKITLTTKDRSEGVSPGWYHHGQLRDLKPSTRYYFVVESDGDITEEYYFITSHTGDEPFKLLSGGDSRMGGQKPRYAGRTPHEDRREMNRLLSELLENNPDILALAHGADWGTTAGWRHLFWWFEDNELVKTSDNRLLPFIAARGNHDMEIGFEENFWLGDLSGARGPDYYYTTRMGSTALITLNTEISISGDQKEWLNKELNSLVSKDPGPTWLMAQYHRPAYPVAKEFDRPAFTRIRNEWTPVFDRYNMDLVLESDGHVLKRTVPIRNYEPADDGIVYIGEGGLGVPQRIPIQDLWFIEEPGFAATAHHVWLLDISPETLNIQAIGIQGDIADEYTLHARNRD